MSGGTAVAARAEAIATETAALAEAMAAETAALEAGDYAAAAGLAPGKARALEAFVALRGSKAAGAPPAELAALHRAALANRAALERALAVQGRVIDMLARAARPRGGAAGYGPGVVRAGGPVAISVRA